MRRIVLAGALIGSLVSAGEPGVPQEEFATHSVAARELAEAIHAEVGALFVEFHYAAESLSAPKDDALVFVLNESVRGQVRLLGLLLGKKKAGFDESLRAVRQVTFLVEMLQWKLGDRERFSKVKDEFTEEQWKEIDDTFLGKESPGPKEMADLVDRFFEKAKTASARIAEDLRK